MSVKFKKLPASQIELEVSLDKKEFNNFWQTAYDRAVAGVVVKGFRPGSAPKEIADRAVDREKVFEAAARNAVHESLSSAAEENGWIFIDQPKIEIFEAKEGLKYKASLSVFPEVELGDYRKIAARVISEKHDVAVEPQEIEKTLNWLRESRAALTRVSRAAAKGDAVEIKVKSSIRGSPVPGGSAENDRFVLGESRYVPGFDDQIAGHKENEVVNFSIDIPADYWHKDLSGKKVDFEARVNAVFERKLPELNDDFAKSLGPNFETIDAVKKNIEGGMRIEKEEKECERLRAKMIEEIVKASKIDPPAIMVQKTTDGMISEVEELARRGGENPYSKEELRERLKERARERVLGNLVMHKIAQTEHLEPTKEEVEEEAKARNLDPEKQYDYSYGIVQHRKLFQFLENQK